LIANATRSRTGNAVYAALATWLYKNSRTKNYVARLRNSLHFCVPTLSLQQFTRQFKGGFVLRLRCRSQQVRHFL